MTGFGRGEGVSGPWKFHWEMRSVNGKSLDVRLRLPAGTEAVEQATGLKPDLSTTGGTSDARFIKDFCPIAEFGLISQSMHKVDECVRLSDMEQLTNIYEIFLDGYFAE